MFVDRIALGVALCLAWCLGAQAQTRLITFEEAEARGALWEVNSVPTGCRVGTPRGSGGAVSALVDIDCQGYVPTTGGRPATTAIVIRLFSRMILEPPWTVQGVAAGYAVTSGAGATVLVTRPGAGATPATRNAWTEIQVAPLGATQGTVRVDLRAMTPALPPPLNSCRVPGANEPIFYCASSADCGAGYSCLPQCGSTCR